MLYGLIYCYLNITSIVRFLKDHWVEENLLRQQQKKLGRQFSGLQKASPRHHNLPLYLCLAVCLSADPSELLTEMCNTLQCTINLQKTHYLIVHWGIQSSPGRWWKGKWNEQHAVNPVLIMLMEWADSLCDEQVMWLCREEETVEQQAKLNKQQTDTYSFNSWL